MALLVIVITRMVVYSVRVQCREVCILYYYKVRIWEFLCSTYA